MVGNINNGQAWFFGYALSVLVRVPSSTSLKQGGWDSRRNNVLINVTTQSETNLLPFETSGHPCHSGAV